MSSANIWPYTIIIDTLSDIFKQKLDLHYFVFTISIINVIIINNNAGFSKTIYELIVDEIY